MMLSIRYHNLAGTVALDTLIENSLIALNEWSRIEEAAVTISHRPDESPAFRASLVVCVPGPDYVVEERDHTPEQVFQRALAILERRMRQRLQRRERQRITHRKHEANFRIGRRSR